MNITVGQKFRTKNRSDILANLTFTVTSLVDDHDFGILRGKQTGVVVTARPGHSTMFPMKTFDEKFELAPSESPTPQKKG